MRQDHVAFVIDNAAWLTGAVLPIAALAMRVAFIGLGMRFVDCLVTLAYTQGQVNLLGIVPLAASVAGWGGSEAPLSIGIALYLVWAWASVSKGPFWRRLIAAILSLIAAQLINAAIVLGVLRFAA